MASLLATGLFDLRDKAAFARLLARLPRIDAQDARLASTTVAAWLESLRLRAVLLLRDVFDYSVREASEALDMSEANVKTTHLRARRAMQAYDGDRSVPVPAEQTRAAQTLKRFLTCLAEHDVAGVESLLAEDVRALSDGGGEFRAALRPIFGRDKVVRFFLGLAESGGPPEGLDFVVVNGLPAVVLTLRPQSPDFATRAVLQLRPDGSGRIRDAYIVLATPKLAGLSAQGAQSRG